MAQTRDPGIAKDVLQPTVFLHRLQQPIGSDDSQMRAVRDSCEIVMTLKEAKERIREQTNLDQEGQKAH